MNPIIDHVINTRTGKRMRKLRTDRGVSALFVANKLGIHPSQLCNLESGRRSWKPALIEKYENLFNGK